jgi:hypothetical protein
MKKRSQSTFLSVGFLGFFVLIPSVLHADVSGDVVYSRHYNNHFDLYRNDGTDLTQKVYHGQIAGMDDGIFEIVGTVDGNVVLGRKYGTGFDLLSYDGSTLAEVGRMSSTTGMDDGLFGMVAATDGTVVVARTWDPPNASPLGFDLIRYDVSQNPIVDLNRSPQNLAGVDDGLFGMVATADNHVVMGRLFNNQFDLLRYDVAADPIAETNRSGLLAGVDAGLFGIVAAADGTVVVARTYAPGGNLGFDLLRFDVTADPIVDLNRSAQNITGVDDGLLDIVATAGGDVVMIRHYDNKWDLLSYDIDPDPSNPAANIVESARNIGARKLDDGYLGAVALGNGDIVLARNRGGAIELFSYDGVTLAEKGHNMGDTRGIDDGFIGLVGFPAQEIPEPASLLLLVSGLLTVLSVSRARVRD